VKITDYVRAAHINAVNKGFYDEFNALRDYSLVNPMPGMEYIKNIHTSNLIMLVVSELSEAVEGLRKGDTENLAEEIADSVIRIMDLSGFLGIDLEKEICKKMAYNETRPARHGKRF